MRPPHPLGAVPAADRASAAAAEAARLRAQGRTAEALAPSRLAARLLPQSPFAAYDLGLTCLEAGAHLEAVRAFETALTLRPRYAEAAWRLGVAQAKLGNAEAALAALERAVALKPSLDEARYWLANTLESLGRLPEAIKAFRRVRSATSGSRLGRLAEARALRLEGNREGLERAARRMIALDPRNGPAHHLLGTVLADSGRFPEAEAAFATALTEDPATVGVWYDLVRCRRLTEADRPLLERMREATRRPGLGAGPAARLQLALGKACDDLGDYEAAMRAFDAAWEARRPRVRFELDAWNRRIDAIIRLFPASRLRQGTAGSSQDRRPLLILGLPRSGTTLVEQILSAHPGVAGGGELPFWLSAGALLSDDADAVDEAWPATLAAAYLQVLRGVDAAAQRVTDKMPFNFLWIGLIHLAFPNATIIWCRRRLVDTALSIHQTLFGEAMGLPTGGDALVGYCRSYRRLMAHWSSALPAGRLVTADYEGLVARPEAEIRRLVARAGLGWDQACLHPERNPRAIESASRWQARQPIYRTALDRWRSYEPYLGPLAALLDDVEPG